MDGVSEKLLEILEELNYKGGEDIPEESPEYLRDSKNFDPRVGIEEGEMKKYETAEILKFLWEHFPEFAKGIIFYYLGNGEHSEEIGSFYKNPDSPEEHAPQYHQWGIITHSKKFEEFFEQKIPQYLLTWGNEKMLEDLKTEDIDGKSKYDLLRLSIPMHDYGKFAVRKKWQKNGEISYSFGGHEKSSGKIIRGELFKKWLKEKLHLSEKQIEYIAQCAELHYELGIVRNKSKKMEGGYSFSFLKTEECTEDVQDLARKYQEIGMEREVGLLFLADSLAKTDIIVPRKNDGDEKLHRDFAQKEIARKKLDPRLIETVLQRSINIALAKKYFEIIS